MTDPVILLGTQSNGETLPVQVDATGRLVAEGLQGPPGEDGAEGPPGPEGPQGPKGDPGDSGGGGKIPTEEPQNPVNGDVWLDDSHCPAILKAWTECPEPGEWMEYECIPLLLIGTPTLVGSAQVSQLLSITKGTVEGGVPPYSYTYTFYDQDNNILKSGSSHEYLIGEDEVGNTIHGTFTTTDSRGTQKVSAASNAIGPIEIAPWTARVDYVIVGGGGSAQADYGQGIRGGGGGGYLSSMPGERSGGDSDPLPPFNLNDQNANNAFTVEIGAADEDTTFSGLGIDRVALKGGGATSGATGMGGHTAKTPGGTPGIEGQGCAGGVAPRSYVSSFCERDSSACDVDCREDGLPGGGGGSGTPGSGMNGGDGTPSSITGQVIYRGGGGGARATCATPGTTGTSGSSVGNPGQGGDFANAAQPGVVILSMPEFLTFERTTGNFVSTRDLIGGNTVIQITSGYGEGRFVVDPAKFEAWLKQSRNDSAY